MCENQAGFHPDRGWIDQIITLREILVMLFVDPGIKGRSSQSMVQFFGGASH